MLTVTFSHQECREGCQEEVIAHLRSASGLWFLLVYSLLSSWLQLATSFLSFLLHNSLTTAHLTKRSRCSCSSLEASRRICNELVITQSLITCEGHVWSQILNHPKLTR
jgi:hypothetical protein